MIESTTAFPGQDCPQQIRSTDAADDVERDDHTDLAGGALAEAVDDQLVVVRWTGPGAISSAMDAGSPNRLLGHGSRMYSASSVNISMPPVTTMQS